MIRPEAAARPFSKDRDGFVMAEGAGALVLESLDMRRGSAPGSWAWWKAAAKWPMVFTARGRHPTASRSPPVCRAPSTMLVWRRTQIGYINAHGTGTPENDKMEWVGVSAVFGSAPLDPDLVQQSMIGHTLTAAGTVEAIFTLLAMRHGRLPPTINYDTPDPALPVDCVPNVARDAQVSHALSNSFGFGGQNVSLVMGLP